MNSELIKQTLSMADVARRYGFEPNRAGYVCCPFHEENSASLKFYEEPGRGWYCFGCNSGGTVVDFVMRLFNLEYKQALMRLSIDFGFANDWQEPGAESRIIEKRRERAKRKREVDEQLSALCQIHCKLHNTIKHSPIWSDEWCDAQDKIDYIAYRIEVLECQQNMTKLG